MNTEDDNKVGLVPSQSSALSRSGTTSLIRRGTQNLYAREEAEQWCNRGSALWHQERYEEAVECFRRGLQLDPNHAQLQFLLGAAYYRGNGVPERDYTQAVFWYRKAAEQGHSTAQCLLGMMYEWSFGIPQDYAYAAEWYRKAAEQGHAGAEYLLGCWYWEGRGVPQDYEQATEWYRKAAEHGEVLAQFNLGVIYGFGRGVSQDYAEAVSWYRKAAERGNAGAQFNLGVMYQFGRGVPQDDAEAVSWYHKAAEQRHGGAANNLAICYARGRGVPQDYEQAAHWYRKAADQGDESAKAVLATLQMVKVPEPSNPKPTSESEPKYPELSRKKNDTVLDDLKAVAEQGLLSPSVKPSFLGIGPDWFVCSQHTFEGNALPEFFSISRNILDCFATALISAPDLQFPASPLVMRCRLGEDRKTLTLYLTAILAVGEQMLPLELKEESEVWIASKLRPLASVKEIALASIFWDRTGSHSFFFFDYPGKMVRDKVPALGAPGEDGKPRWPECELLLDPVTATLREKARCTIDFVHSTTERPIQ